MTGSRSASARAAANNRRGKVAEQCLVRWLREHGFGGAERTVRTGYRARERQLADAGDVTGVPGLVISVKDCQVERVDLWMRELADMCRHGDVGLLVVKRRGRPDPGGWWAWLQLADLKQLTSDRLMNTGWQTRTPVRLEVAAAVELLREAGYGDQS